MDTHELYNIYIYIFYIYSNNNNNNNNNNIWLCAIWFYMDQTWSKARCPGQNGGRIFRDSAEVPRSTCLPRRRGELLGRLMFRQSHIIVLAVYRSYICIYLYVSYVFKYVYTDIYIYICIICIYIYISYMYVYIYMYTFFKPIIFSYIYIYV